MQDKKDYGYSNYDETCVSSDNPANKNVLTALPLTQSP